MQHRPTVGVRNGKIDDLEDEGEWIEPHFTDLRDAVVGLRDGAANLRLDNAWDDEEADGRIDGKCAGHAHKTQRVKMRGTNFMGAPA